MLAMVLLSVWVGAGPELGVEARQGIDPIRERQLVEALARAIGHRVGANAEPAKERVGLKLFGGLTRLRIIAERRGSATIITEELELPLDPDLWEPELDALARRLYPEVAQPTSLELGPTKVAEPEVEWPRWALLSGAAAAVVVGVIFTARGWSARSASSADGLGTTQVEAEVADQRTAAWVAGGSFTLGLGLSIAGLLY